jgi:hypothetical protein
MLAFVAVAQNVVAEPSVSADASPPKADPVSFLAVHERRARVTAAVTAEKRFTRQAGAGPTGMRAKSHPSIV